MLCLFDTTSLFLRYTRNDFVFLFILRHDYMFVQPLRSSLCTTLDSTVKLSTLIVNHTSRLVPKVGRLYEQYLHGRHVR
jgi:hypothetical protein